MQENDIMLLLSIRVRRARLWSLVTLAKRLNPAPQIIVITEMPTVVAPVGGCAFGRATLRRFVRSG